MLHTMSHICNHSHLLLFVINAAVWNTAGCENIESLLLQCLNRLLNLDYYTVYIIIEW